MIDFGTIIGLFSGFLVVIMGILTAEGGNLAYYIDLPSAFITVGGATCAMLVNFPLRDLKGVFGVLRQAFFTKPLSPEKIIADFRRFADVARRDGILALENVTQEIQDPFLVKGIQLAVDGTDPEVIQTMMQTELDNMVGRHDRGIKVLKQMAALAPAFGMIGTLIGLVLMLQNLDDPSKLGPGMAVAIVTTFYGAIIAYLVCTPMAERLTIRSSDEVLIREMMIKGVMSIQSGDNPRIVEQKLRIFMSPRARGAAT